MGSEMCIRDRAELTQLLFASCYLFSRSPCVLCLNHFRPLLLSVLRVSLVQCSDSGCNIPINNGRHKLKALIRYVYGSHLVTMRAYYNL